MGVIQIFAFLPASGFRKNIVCDSLSEEMIEHSVTEEVKNHRPLFSVYGNFLHREINERMSGHGFVFHYVPFSETSLLQVCNYMCITQLSPLLKTAWLRTISSYKCV